MKHLLKLIKRDLPYFGLVAGAFILFIIFGANLQELEPKTAKELTDLVMNTLKPIAIKYQNASVLVRILIIFFNNLSVSITTILSGVIPLFPSISLFMNGIVIGLIQRLVMSDGHNVIKFYLSIIPHGIFELSAFFIAVYLGFRLNLIPFQLIVHYKKTGEHRSYYKEFFHDVQYYGILIMILLAIAAVIEVTISPLI